MGSFTKTDGTIGTATDVWFQTDKAYTIATEWLDVPEEIAALPDLQGYGNAITCTKHGGEYHWAVRGISRE
ncbi:MAG: hypothetical protein PHR03_09315 [Desulfovibrionales bacterium]|nr:hypothetical protein [Desulfovibrionales bacterium]